MKRIGLALIITFVVHPLFAQSRWLVHLTSSNGGFVSELRIVNDGGSDRSYVIQPYQIDGLPLPQVTGQVAGQQTVLMNVSDYLGSSASHARIVSSDADLTFSVDYRVASGRGSPATIQTTGSNREVRFFAGDWQNVFDGIAIVNTSTSPTSVTLSQINRQGQTTNQIMISQSLAANAKTLFVLGGPQGGPFDRSAGERFRLQSDGDVAFIALQGTPPGSEVGYLWQNDLLPTVEGLQRWLPHITSPNGGFQSEILAVNTTNSVRTFQLNAYDARGQVVGQFTSSINGQATLALQPQSIWPAVGGLSHVEVLNTSPNVVFGMRYRAVSGLSSPAISWESDQFSQHWRLTSGQWTEIFDGIAIINGGPLKTDVAVSLIGQDGQTLKTVFGVRALEPLAKSLLVLGGPADGLFDENAAFIEITSSTPVLVLGLRGSPPQAGPNYLWANPVSTLDLRETIDQSRFAIPVDISGNRVSGFVTPFVPIESEVSGLSIRILDPFPHGGHSRDHVIATSTSDTAGRFEILDLPSGLLYLEILYESTWIRVPFTNVQAALIDPTTSYAIKREDAFSSVDVAESDLLVCTMQPIPAGTLFTLRDEIAYGQNSRVFQEAVWVLLQDKDFNADFGKPITYHFVGAQTGAISSWSTNSTLSLNYSPLWFDQGPLLIWEKESSAYANQQTTPLTAPNWSPEVVQPVDLKDTTKASSFYFSKKTNEDTFAIVVNGGIEPRFYANASNMLKLFESSIPAGQVAFVDYDLYTAEHHQSLLIDGTNIYKQQFEQYNKQMRQLRLEGKEPTLIIYVAAHHSIDTDNSFTGTMLMECHTSAQTPALTLGLTASRMCLEESFACKVRVILQTCSSETILSDLNERLISDSDAHLSDFAGIGASLTDESAYGPRGIFGDQPISYFTQTLLDHLVVDDGDITGLTNEMGDLIGPIDFVDGPLHFNSHGFLTRFGEGAPCPPIDDPFLDFPNEEALSHMFFSRQCFPDAQKIETFTIENPRIDVEINFAVYSDHPSLFFQPADGKIPPGGKVDVCVFISTPEAETDARMATIEVDSWRQSTSQIHTDSFDVDVRAGSDADHPDIIQAMCPEEGPSSIAEAITGQSFFPLVGISSINSVGDVGVPDYDVEIDYVHAIKKNITRLADRFKRRSCGMTDLGLVVCAEPSSPIPETAEYLVVSNVTRGSIPLNDPENYYQFGFVFDADRNEINNFDPHPNFPFDLYQNTDRWYSLEYSPISGWQLIVSRARGSISRVNSAARVVIRDNVLTLAVPLSEFEVENPLYRLTSYRHKGDFGLNPPFNWSGDLEPAVGQPLLEIFE